MAILIQNADGFITHQKVFMPVDGMPDAEIIAAIDGFDLDGDWFSQDDENPICYLKAKPLLISFVADSITDEDAVAAARSAGWPVLSLISKQSVPEKGKVECQFLLELPIGFTLDGYVPLEPFSE